MGEKIDEKPAVESFQTDTAQPLSDHITTDYHQRFCPTWENGQHEEVIKIERELANARVELEAKGSAYEQALLKLENQQKTVDELAILLRRTDIQKDYYINDYEEANARVSELQSSVNLMARKLSESQDAQEQLAHAMDDLVDTRSELDGLKKANTELESRFEETRSALSDEKVKGEELLRQVSDMKEAIVRLQMKVIEIEREKAEALYVKEIELESATKDLSEAEEQLKTLSDLEARIAEKSSNINSLQIEIMEVNELYRTSKEAVSQAIYEAKVLKEQSEVQEKKNSDQAAHIGLLEAELKETRAELGSMNVEVGCLREEIDEMRTKLDKSTEKENDAQVEIALLKFELHKGRAKLAAAEAAEVRTQAEKTALYNALQQMGLEAEETKKENRALKEALSVQHNEDQNHCDHEIYQSKQVDDDKDEEDQNHCDHEIYQSKQVDDDKDEEDQNHCDHEIYQSKQVDDDKNEENRLQIVVAAPQNTKNETEMLMQKIGELRARAEQAISRAEAAEKAKFALEEKAKRRKEHKERRKAALAALREESISREIESGDGMIIKYEAESPKHYQPLSKVLNMKF